jgi:hypothetical protein
MTLSVILGSPMEKMRLVIGQEISEQGGPME